MKLSKQLIEHAEWWLSTEVDSDIYHTEASYHLDFIQELGFRKTRTLPDRANLILLEAEYQKDIESTQENPPC